MFSDEQVSSLFGQIDDDLRRDLTHVRHRLTQAQRQSNLLEHGADEDKWKVLNANGDGEDDDDTTAPELTSVEAKALGEDVERFQKIASTIAEKIDSARRKEADARRNLRIGEDQSSSSSSSAAVITQSIVSSLEAVRASCPLVMQHCPEEMHSTLCSLLVEASLIERGGNLSAMEPGRRKGGGAASVPESLANAVVEEVLTRLFCDPGGVNDPKAVSNGTVPLHLSELHPSCVRMAMLRPGRWRDDEVIKACTNFNLALSLRRSSIQEDTTTDNSSSRSHCWLKDTVSYIYWCCRPNNSTGSDNEEEVYQTPTTSSPTTASTQQARFNLDAWIKESYAPVLLRQECPRVIDQCLSPASSSNSTEVEDGSDSALTSMSLSETFDWIYTMMLRPNLAFGSNTTRTVLYRVLLLVQHLARRQSGIIALPSSSSSAMAASSSGGVTALAGTVGASADGGGGVLSLIEHWATKNGILQDVETQPDEEGHTVRCLLPHSSSSTTDGAASMKQKKKQKPLRYFVEREQVYLKLKNSNQELSSVQDLFDLASQRLL